MAYDDTLIVDHLNKTHDTNLLTEREEHLIGLAVTMTRGCQVCTRNRIHKARGIGISDDELNALIAVTAAVNSGVTAANRHGNWAHVDIELGSPTESALVAIGLPRNPRFKRASELTRKSSLLALPVFRPCRFGMLGVDANVVLIN